MYCLIVARALRVEPPGATPAFTLDAMSNPGTSYKYRVDRICRKGVILGFARESALARGHLRRFSDKHLHLLGINIAEGYHWRPEQQETLIGEPRSTQISNACFLLFLQIHKAPLTPWSIPTQCIYKGIKANQLQGLEILLAWLHFSQWRQFICVCLPLLCLLPVVGHILQAQQPPPLKGLLAVQSRGQGLQQKLYCMQQFQRYCPGRVMVKLVGLWEWLQTPAKCSPDILFHHSVVYQF